MPFNLCHACFSAHVGKAAGVQMPSALKFKPHSTTSVLASKKVGRLIMRCTCTWNNHLRRKVRYIYMYAVVLPLRFYLIYRVNYHVSIASCLILRLALREKEPSVMNLHQHIPRVSLRIQQKYYGSSQSTIMAPSKIVSLLCAVRLCPLTQDFS